MKVTYQMIKKFEEIKYLELYSLRNTFVAKILYETISNHYVQQRTSFEKLSKFARAQWIVKAFIIRRQIHDESKFVL